MFSKCINAFRIGIIEFWKLSEAVSYTWRVGWNGIVLFCEFQNMLPCARTRVITFIYFYHRVKMVISRVHWQEPVMSLLTG